MKIKTRRLGLALAAVSATMAVSGIGAGGAQAALPGHCLGSSSVAGVGSSLQGAAQNIWKTSFGTASAANGGCSGKSATYTATSSGNCLATFGAGGAAINTSISFCGTDDAPDATQIANITTTGGSAPLSIPVAQSAIAIVVNPPSGCTVTTITPAQLETAFRGAAANWAALGGSGTCTAAVNPVVRNDNSGTTYQLKHYLTTANSAVVHNGLTWAGLQGGTNNTTWPGTVTKSQSGCATAMSLPCSGGANSGSGGSDEVRTVAATSGSIGYAALSDARAVYTALVGTSPNLKWVNLRPALTAINPSTNGLSTTKANSNCPTANSAYGTLPSATGNWSGVYLSAAGSAYPICTLTWDLALSNYASKYGAGSGNIAQTTKDYLHYVLLGGQADGLSSANDYQVLPHDVNTVATAGVGEITG
jgi:hypothetical protein